MKVSDEAFSPERVGTTSTIWVRFAGRGQRVAHLLTLSYGEASERLVAPARRTLHGLKLHRMLLLETAKTTLIARSKHLHR